MGWLRGRIRKVEEKAYGGPAPPCPACGDFIILEEIVEAGTSVFPYGGPCPTCDSRPASGRIGRIAVHLGNRAGDEDEDEVDEAVEWP